MAGAVTKFNQAAQKQDPAIFDYAREVERVWRDFPQTKRVFFLDICKRKLIYPEAGGAQEKMLRFLNNKADLLSGVEKMDRIEKSSCYMPYHGAMLLYTQQHKYSFLDKTAPQAMETMFVFDHEMGHAVIPNANYGDGKNKAECIADAYAVIRHLQRYGADSPVIDAVVQQRAFQFVFRKDRSTHLTSPVIEQILARRHDFSWENLTPQETAPLAWRFAMKYALQPALLEAIDRDFKEFQGGIERVEGGDDALLRKLAEKVLSTDSPYVFKYGAAALNLCLGAHHVKVSLSGDYWDDFRRKLDEKQAVFAKQESLLFGLGANDNLPPKEIRP